MHSPSSSALVLVVLASVAAAALLLPSASAALSEEEQQFLAREVRAFLSQQQQQQGAGLRQHQPAYDNHAAFATYLDRRLRNSADAAKGRGSGNWNNMGMNNLFRLDKRSAPAYYQKEMEQ